MTLKLLPGNPCKSALASLSQDDLFRLGIHPGNLTLQNSKTRRLLGFILELLRQAAGLSRDGQYVTVMCRPLKKGGCRFIIRFTDQPCGRVFEFRNADDLLDAVNHLRKTEKTLLSEIRIDSSGGNFYIYIPADMNISKSALIILSDYSI